ncbi:MAG: hypothetical protein D6793_00370 [Thermoflexia bacterium]|nr:MAG: hypothetical protein D6793_00370 [Thermoflexia bacterium]
MERRFPVLRSTGTICKTLAWIALVPGILGALLTLVLSLTASLPFQRMFLRQDGRLILGGAGSMGLFILGLVCFLVFYATGEGIYLFLAIEENTREIALLLRERETPRVPYPEPYPGSPLPERPEVPPRDS